MKSAQGNQEEASYNSHYLAAGRKNTKVQNSKSSKFNHVPVREIYDMTGIEDGTNENSVHSSVIRDGHASSGGAVGRSFTHHNQ